MAMESAKLATAARAGRDAGGWERRLQAACLVLFPLLFLLLAGTGIHPDPAGETAAAQVRAVAASAEAWRTVQLLLTAASLLGIGAVGALRSLVPGRGRRSVAASAAAAVGVAAAGLVAGIVAAEAGLVAPVAEACASSSACLSPDNEAFLGAFADASWNDLTLLSYAAGSLLFSLAALAALGWTAKSVRPWEALLLLVGIVGIYATNTVLHGAARYGLMLVLVACVSIALRMERRPRHG